MYRQTDRPRYSNICRNRGSRFQRCRLIIRSNDLDSGIDGYQTDVAQFRHADCTDCYHQRLTEPNVILVRRRRFAPTCHELTVFLCCSTGVASVISLAGVPLNTLFHGRTRTAYTVVSRVV